MKGRIHRLQLIERLIRERVIANQEQLQVLLNEEGLEVTQATLSRDLHSLKAYRAVGENGELRYLVPSLHLDHTTKADIVRGLLSVSNSNNLVVVRTPVAFAPIFASAFERLAMNEVLGVVAGFDTVLIVLKENASMKSFYAQLRKKIPELNLKGAF